MRRTMAVSILTQPELDEETISRRNHVKDQRPSSAVQPIKIHPGVATGLILFHLSVVLAPWTFTWTGLLTAWALALVTGQLGLSLGSHRLLCPRSLATAPWFRYMFAFLGVLACQKGPLAWCALHRLHHRDADSERDPQMSGRGFLWAHILWAATDRVAGVLTERRARTIIADLNRDPVLRFLERHFLAINVLFALALFLLGWLLDGFHLAASLLVWAFFLRILYTWHVTFLVNSVSHRWGYRNYQSPDNSHNCWWVALLSFGEGWHNNHHHRPRCASHGHRWFEFDLTFTVIRLLEWSGLAHSVVYPAKNPCPQRVISNPKIVKSSVCRTSLKSSCANRSTRSSMARS